LIAYVNHDDLWFPDHLARAVEMLEATGADGVFAMGLDLAPGGAVRLLGASQTGEYHPNMGIPASLWVMRREVIAALGGWRSCRETYTVPSQDFLVRAWKAGFRIRMVPAATVLCIPSGQRQGSYSERQESEHAAAARQMKEDPGYREALLLAALQAAGSEADLPLWLPARRLAGNALKRLGLVFGIAPVQVVSFILGRRKAGLIQKLRRHRGLTPLPPPPAEPPT
jgi:GT2 family glycosyltransferase